MHWMRAAIIAAGVALMWFFRGFVWQALTQLFFGMLAAMLAMPLMRRLETRFSCSAAASLSMLGLGAIAVSVLALLTPMLISQTRQAAQVLPQLAAQVSQWSERAQEWLARNGVNLTGDTQLMDKAQEMIQTALPTALSRAGGALSGLSKVMLAPVFAFYFLRDRRQISQWLLLLLPISWRKPAVRALREMRREMAGFVRGQLMVSLAVGTLTAVGLLLCGAPAWLLLGVLMGVLELIPYVGPVIGGALAVLFALPGGFSRALWALAVVLVVQQLEGGMLSPKLMSDATRLHPVAVLLCVMVGAMAGGMVGIVLSVPALLCARALLRVLLLREE